LIASPTRHSSVTQLSTNPSIQNGIPRRTGANRCAVS
jgi:hypothetical protein